MGNARHLEIRRPRFYDKPHYLFRPQLALGRRARLATGRVRLPWGSIIECDVTDQLGGQIARSCIYEPLVTEAIYRLLGPGQVAVDVGANIGYVTSLMAARVGPSGIVYALEPQPEVFAQLQRNIPDSVVALQAAASSRAGSATLRIPLRDGAHHTRASLGKPHGGSEVSTVTVATVTLDEIIQGPVAVLKLDAEGHELEVLAGARRTLSQTATVIFEEFLRPPTPVSELLEFEGFTIFLLQSAFWGPRLVPAAQCREHVGWDAPNFIATRDPGSLIAEMKPRGWQSLRG